MQLLKKLFGSRNERVLRRCQRMVDEVNRLEPSYQALSDADLRAKSDEFKQRLANGATLDDVLPEAFAAVREASQRVLGMRHFDVQLVGGMILHQGDIAEMRTGEGKTLMATLPVYLNALSGKGVHVVTVNDYLAKRDAEWMQPVYEFLGMTVGVNLTTSSRAEKQAAYQADITYGTNNEFGFDYLRDNMAFSLEDKVQRELNFAIVDEVDSILIDEARTPLIISGPAEDSSELYLVMNRLVPTLTLQKEEDGPGDYSVDEKVKQAYLTEAGHESAEVWLRKEGMIAADEGLYDAKHISLVHHLNAALRAHALFNRDVDYIIRDGQVMIVDEHTGRVLPGRRWSDGLHQAVEAKEGVKIQNENQTLATITFQNYFRLFDKLAGMTGTADTEAYEFQQIYGLEVVVIPTHKPMVRKDHADVVFLTQEEKFEAIIKEIAECHEKGQPVLVGTASIESSELVSQLMKKRGIPHHVLNAKHHEQEAQIIAEAGRPKAVTIATNMAGRGTDIVLGGSLDAELAQLDNPSERDIEQHKLDWQRRHDEVLAAGGLHVLATERNEARRIDNQLRGRSGRQGDPGSSRFYLSLEDNLMRIFASDRVAGLMQRLGMGRGEPIEHSWVSKAIENAQRKVEGHNFDIRKQLIEYDDVANEQRKVVYEQRAELMAATNISETIAAIREDVVHHVVDEFIPPESLEEQWDVPGLEQRLHNDLALKLPVRESLEKDDQLHEEQLRQQIFDALVANYEQKESQVGSDVMRQFEKSVMLQALDTHWKDHLSAMDHLRQSIQLRSYAQKNPKQEYKREAFALFSSMLDNIKHNVVSILANVQVRSEDVEAMEAQRRRVAEREMQFQHATADVMAHADGDDEPNDQKVVPFTRDGRKVGRNDPCPCGSGKKFKQCHGRLQ